MPHMANVLMLGLSLLVVLTSSGVLFWFFRRLRRIEWELWGEKRREAAETASTVPEDTELSKTDATAASEDVEKSSTE